MPCDKSSPDGVHQSLKILSVQCSDSVAILALEWNEMGSKGRMETFGQ